MQPHAIKQRTKLLSITNAMNKMKKSTFKFIVDLFSQV